MSNPARAPTVSSAGQALLNIYDTDSFFPNVEAARKLIQGNKDLTKAQAILNTLDMDMHPTVRIPVEMTCDKAILQSGGGLARADTGGLTFRIRSSQGKGFANAGFGLLPKSGVHGQDVVRARMKNIFLADFGAEGTLGRLAMAYPKRGSPPPPYPITAEEAQAALRHAGWRSEAIPPTPLPLNKTTPDGRAVTVNPNSDNGFPVLSKWKDELAADMCMGMALEIRKTLETGGKPVWEWVRMMEACNPEIVACRGKGKADYYPTEKIAEARGRFYNALPRQILLIMQQATQPFEQSCLSVVDWVDSRTVSGVTLVRGGAAELVEALERMLEKHSYAYVHMGDDSWVAIKNGGYIAMFALDCSNFDLTQHASVSREIHLAVRTELRKIDPISADLWYAYARERLVVVSTTLVRKFKHAGPSGMPMQSKVNDMMMDVMIQRLLLQINTLNLEHPETLDTKLQEIGNGMGFKVRLEQFRCVRADTIKEALAIEPFLFIGYYFHVVDGTVAVHCDVARTFSQVPYPTLKWMKKGEEALATEAMRIGSIAQNLGIPSPPLREAFTAMRDYAIALVERAIHESGDVPNSRLIWAVNDNPFGAAVEPSLKGLLRVLQRDPEVLWGGMLPATSELIYGSWADEVDNEEVAEGFMGRQAATVRKPLAKPIKTRPIPTHPVTRVNDGRPGPTVVWGPDKPKRSHALERLRESRAERRRGGGGVRPASPETAESVSWGSDDWDWED